MSNEERVLGVCPCGKPFDASTGYNGRKRGGPRREFCQPSCRHREASRRRREVVATDLLRVRRERWAALGQTEMEF